MSPVSSSSSSSSFSSSSLLLPFLSFFFFWQSLPPSSSSSSLLLVPAAPPSRGGDVAVYVIELNQLSLPSPFLFCCCVCLCLYGPFNCFSFHKFSLECSGFSLCSSGLISSLLVLSTIHLFMKVSLSPDIIICG